MEIKIKNDGKQRAQSFEANIDINAGITAWGYFDAHIEGYGVDEWSAKQNLIEQVDRLIEKLNILKELNN